MHKGKGSTGWPTVKRGIMEFHHGILGARFVSQERFYCNNNASYMPICLRQCIWLNRKYNNIYKMQHWSGAFG